MKNTIQLNSAIPSIRNSPDRSPYWRRGFLLIPLVLASFALSPQARAACRDGCASNGDAFLGESALLNDFEGFDNTAIGYEALLSNDSGSENAAIGAYALYANLDGYDNTAVGGYALYNSTGGSYNTAVGHQALYTNTTGSNNTAIGEDALSFNITGTANVASGNAALQFNTTGSNNTADGFIALYNTTTGSNNTGTGSSALHNNSTGNDNTANGANALVGNTTGDDNTANGYQALTNNTIGFRNTASGLSALASNTSGSQNTADGANALFRNTAGVGNMAIGFNSLFNNTTGGNNTAVGAAAGSRLTTGSNNIDIANIGAAAEAGTIRIGTKGTQTATFIAGISGATVAGGVGVVVDSNGHLGTVVSSERYKDAIEPMDKASEAILSLRPVTFRYKKELDPKSIPQFGLVAEEVAKVNPDLVARDDEGKPYTVRYEAVNAMLLNEFLKEHRKGEQQDRKIGQLEAMVAKLQSALKEQGERIEAVSAALEASKPSTRLAANNP